LPRAICPLRIEIESNTLDLLLISRVSPRGQSWIRWGPSVIEANHMPPPHIAGQPPSDAVPVRTGIRVDPLPRSSDGSTFGGHEGARMDQNDPIDIQPPAAGPMTISGRESIAATRARNIMPSFLAELTRVMQAAAERERERIDEVIAEEAAEHVEKTRTRAAAETEELRRLAEVDVEHIQDWAATEIERIRGEADRRTHERRADLEGYLAQHDTIIATEIDEVDAAVRGYRATLDQFFNELSGSTDPSDIARRAGSLPAPPDLEGARAAARANAVARALTAPQVATDEPVGDELGWGGESGARPSVDTDPGDEPLAESGAGLGVMDPDAVGRSTGLSDVLGEMDAEAATESASAPPADPLYVGADVAVEIDSPEPAETFSPAVRLLRSIAPWTTPVVPGPEGHDSKDE
jgi:hypothetical protein